MVRQQHGFDFERTIIDAYNLERTNEYHHKYDAYYKKIPVQIKCIKFGNTVDLASYSRNRAKTEDFILVIGFWKNTKENIVKRYILYIDHKKYIEQMKFDYCKNMSSDIKLITNLKVDDVKWKTFCKKYKDLYPRCNMIRIRFKRDHKLQKRIQCSITWKNFNNWFLNEFKQIELDI
jgi:hypothetical protein